jgi:hypothetical protein
MGEKASKLAGVTRDESSCSLRQSGEDLLRKGDAVRST